MRWARSAASRAASSTAGDELPVGKRQRRQGRPQPSPPRCAARPASPAELRMLPGLYWHRITEAAGQQFLRRYLEGGAGGRPHRLSLPRRHGRSNSCRASSRSAPAPIPPTSSMPAIPMARSRCRAAPSRSCCIATRFRAAAISWSGTVISADMDLIGQLQPHTPAKFVEIDMAEALAARSDRDAALAKAREAIG